MPNNSYEKINWGWLNDYNGYKFAPITFIEQLYTENGYSFQDIYNQQWQDLKSGKMIAGAAGTLVDKNNNEQLLTTLKDTPVYFENGIPTSCNQTLVSNILGNVNVLMTESEKKKLKNDINVLLEDSSTALSIIEELSNKGSLSSSEQTQLTDAKSTLASIERNLMKYTTINANSITGSVINADTINSSNLNVDSAIMFNDPINLTFISDDITADKITIESSNSSQDINISLTPIDTITPGKYGPENSDETTLQAGSSFKVPNYTVDDKGRITNSNTITYTLPEKEEEKEIYFSTQITLSTNWSDKKQEVNVQGVTADNSQPIFISPNTASKEVYFSCGIEPIEQGNNTITFMCEEVPDTSVVVNVVGFF